MNEGPWVGWDLDGTLAHYGKWAGVNHIGAPIRANIDRLAYVISNGTRCKIFTARVAGGGEEARLAEQAIQNWLKAQGLPKLEVTCKKDFAMVLLIDDRCVAMEANTGKILGAADWASDWLGPQNISENNLLLPATAK